MKRLLLSCILVLALIGLSCAPQATLEISVTELNNGVMIENAGNVDCLVFISSLEGEQQFKLAVGHNITVTDISQPIEVAAVSVKSGEG
jgi:hypothetical protein